MVFLPKDCTSIILFLKPKQIEKFDWMSTSDYNLNWNWSAVLAFNGGVHNVV